MQWTKNKCLEELRETKLRYEEEKKKEKEEMLEIENKMRLKNIEIDNEKQAYHFLEDIPFFNDPDGSNSL